jgi:Fe(3+) dicitrate transport protein
MCTQYHNPHDPKCNSPLINSNQTQDKSFSKTYNLMRMNTFSLKSIRMVLAILVFGMSGYLNAQPLSNDSSKQTKPAKTQDSSTKAPENAAKTKYASEPTRLLPVVVEGGKIYEGKKVTVTELEATPPTVNNNMRQVFTQAPGLLVSEQNIPSHINMNYRGIGDPHESEFVLPLKDGVPTTMDWFGYPTAYYAPPIESIQSIEFVRGGSALLYGPQPGPVINYITYLPTRERKFTASTRHIFGSDGLYSTYNQFNGTLDTFGYLGYFHHRGGDGPRVNNSDFSVYNGSMKLVLDEHDDSRWIFTFEGYESESGEAGRLTLAQYLANRDQTVRLNDRIWTRRYALSLTNERALFADTLLTVKSWGGFQDRFSRRQASATSQNFNLDDQDFFTGGLDARVQHNWQAWENEHTLTGGFVSYASHAPRERELTTDPHTTDGARIFDMDRHTLYGSIFAENRFQFGRFGIIPAVRLEQMEIHVQENTNSGVSRALIKDTFTATVPLFGIGLTYDLGSNNRLYANVSQGYRPPKYDDLANPTSNTQLISPDLNEGSTMNYELGLRGRPEPWFSYDTSLFLTDFDDMIESVAIGGGNLTRQNSGDAVFGGWESLVEIDLFGLTDAVSNRQPRSRDHRVSLFANSSLLDAEFESGNSRGNTPAYAPDYIVKTGVIYRWKDSFKLALSGTMVDDHFWQDSNAAGSVGTSVVAAYSVWDLTAEAKIYKDRVSILAGINNLADEDYYSRIRSDGIDPAYGRNFYVGASFTY